MSVTPFMDNLAQTNECVICLERKSTPKVITLIKQICCNFENSTGKRRPTCTNQHESHSPYQGGNLKSPEHGLGINIGKKSKLSLKV